MPIIDVESIVGVVTEDGRAFCRDCFDGDLADPSLTLVDEYDVHRDEGVKIYKCDACKEKFMQ